MKHTIIKWAYTIVTLVFLCPAHQVAAQTDYNVPLTFSVASIGINRFIASQWSASTFTKSWSGYTTSGIQYSISLDRPSVVLSENTIKILLALTIHAEDITDQYVVYDGKVTITPTLTIPSTTISLNSIMSQYTNLRQQIDAITQIADVRLRDVLEQKLAPIEWIVYQGKILEGSQTRIIETSDIRLIGTPTLNFAVSNSEVLFTVVTTLRAKAPEYFFSYYRTNGNTTYNLTVRSNDKFVLVSNDCRIFSFLAQTWDPTTGSSEVTATYDSNSDQYVAIETLTYSAGLSDYSNSLRIKLKRGGVETLWTLVEQNGTVVVDYGE